MELMELMPKDWFNDMQMGRFRLTRAKREFACIGCYGKFNVGTYYIGNNRFNKICCKCFSQRIDNSITQFKENAKELVDYVRKLDKKVSGKRILNKNVISQL